MCNHILLLHVNGCGLRIRADLLPPELLGVDQSLCYSSHDVPQ